MNALILTVFLSGFLNNPCALLGEKDYVREVDKFVSITSEMIEVEIPLENYYKMKSGIQFMLEDSFGRKGDYIFDLIEEEKLKVIKSRKDFELIEIAIDCKQVEIEKHFDLMVLKYERSYG